ncbi:unnamed protein product [Urochloa humidicola]
MGVDILATGAVIQKPPGSGQPAPLEKHWFASPPPFLALASRVSLSSSLGASVARLPLPSRPGRSRSLAGRCVLYMLLRWW